LFLLLTIYPKLIQAVVKNFLLCLPRQHFLQELTVRDVVEGLNRYKKEGIRYWGGDLRNGYDLTKQDLPGRYDFCWIHPPYWNIIRYSDRQNDMSNCETYVQFRELLMVCLKRCYKALMPGGRLAVLIGDVRKKGKYTAIIKDILNFSYGELKPIIIKVQHNCVSDRKSYGKLEDPPIKHEYCVVFKKPVLERQNQTEHMIGQNMEFT